MSCRFLEKCEDAPRASHARFIHGSPLIEIQRSPHNDVKAHSLLQEDTVFVKLTSD